MAQYRKKPVIIEAMQLTPQTVRDVYEFVHGPVTITDASAEYWDDYCDGIRTGGMDIPTLEDGPDKRAKHVALIGDWIIKGVQGEFYPCKPDIFAATYDAVTAKGDPQ